MAQAVDRLHLLGLQPATLHGLLACSAKHTQRAHAACLCAPRTHSHKPQVQLLGLLRFMLTQLAQDKRTVALEQAADVEARCLNALGWRMGPFFMEDELSGVCACVCVCVCGT
jgi:hypothetical protein